MRYSEKQPIEDEKDSIHQLRDNPVATSAARRSLANLLRQPKPQRLHVD